MKIKRKFIPAVGYIKGVSCGNEDCYSCYTMKGDCKELDRLDKEEVEHQEHMKKMRANPLWKNYQKQYFNKDV